MASTKRSNKGQQSAAARARRQEKAQAAAEAKEAKERRKSLGIKIAAAVFALLMGLSMLLPSLSYFFSNSQTEAQTMSNVSVSGATTVEEVDAAFSSVVDELEEKLERSGDNAKVLVRLGNDYMNWASYASTYATTDAERLHVQELYDKAGECFDRFLALKDNPDVAARRGLAYYYAGETQEGIRFLEEFTATTTDHAPSWVYLGMMYEATGDTEAAKHAYVNAAKADPNDTYGLREYINGRIAQLNSDGYTSGDALELSLDDAS